MIEQSAISRRNLLQQLSIITAGIGLTQIGACKNSEEAKAPSTAVSSPILAPFSLAPMAPLEPGPGGVDIRTWVRSSKTNGQFSCVETAVAPKKMGPAPHLHEALDEIMYVIEGTATVMVDGKVEEIPTGGWHMRPRKIEHTFWNSSDKKLRLIDMYFNQNFEDFLEELFHSIIPDMAKNNLTPADPVIGKRLSDLDKKFGITTFPEKRQAIVDKYGLIS